MTNRIHLISGPRNVSTALMYSFGNRADTEAIDEPMYGVYLKLHKVDHPGKEEVAEHMSSDMSVIREEIIDKRYSKEIVFFKNMAHHFIGVDHSFIHTLKNVFLIRDPRQLIASFAQVIPNPTMRDIGLQKEFELFSDTKQNGKYEPIVLDSGELLKNPKKVLTSLCAQLDISFDEDMLHWKKGPRKFDGVWAKYWYKNVHKSEGFVKQTTNKRELPVHLEALYLEALPYYEHLLKESILA